MKKIKCNKESGNIWVIVIAIIALLVSFLIQNYVISLSRIVGESMTPVLYEKDWIITNRLAYDEKSPQRNDVILFRKNEIERNMIVKRVVGLPLDRIEIKSGVLFINETPLLGKIPFMEEDFSMSEVTVPSEHYFVMGDNYKESVDSRYWEDPFVAESELIGKVIYKIYEGIKQVK